ncbi:MAG: UbiA family prenyltransferase [Alphaproteobacteria bacterium]|nr:UbiA family prenyltransferase [Alphaproteobacteria bacterium]MDA8004166.1 UbiA family prenyltransferase [Alphaproteobacteria bacterium]MDA8005574.1 UbiA family prenyltransferase [Alphaproteobacteria bacterium]MDA8012581.1 UbiA family prenyltransferase [Alphaproteobacteria bacterium]
MGTPEDKKPDASDIRFEGLLLAHAPAALRPWISLARLDRPVGWLLLLLPGWWALALAGSADVGLYLLFLFGAVVMRAAGCVVNDLADRDLDRQIARTAERPLAAGHVGARGAVIFLLLLLVIGAEVLLALPADAILLGCAALPLIFAYPRMKRIVWWPQAFLAFVFNWGALLGWVAAGESLVSAAVWFLYGGAFFWTLGYDTLYASADLEDDERVGVRSLARLFGGRIRYFVAGCFILAAVLWACALVFSGVVWFVWLGWGWMVFALLRCAGRLPAGGAPEPAAALADFRRQPRAALVFWVFLLFGS